MPWKHSKFRLMAVPVAALLSCASIAVSLAMPRPVTHMPSIMSSLDHINQRTAEIMVALNDEVAMNDFEGGTSGLMIAMRWEGKIMGPLRILRAAADDYAHIRGDREDAAQLREICDRLEGVLSRAYALQGVRIAALRSTKDAVAPFREVHVRGLDFHSASLGLGIAIREAEREGLAADRWVSARLDE